MLIAGIHLVNVANGGHLVENIIYLYSYSYLLYIEARLGLLFS